MNNKEKIIELFYQNVKGRKADTSSNNQKHDGKKGHWLETQMGIKHNGDNAPDLFGYEMKNQTTSGKITFGDWSADEYIFIHGRGKNPTRNNTNQNYNITRDNFLEIFGKPNTLKNNRLSWSGTPCPTYFGDISPFGQSLAIDSNNDIVIIYSFSNDMRENKSELIPLSMQIDNLVIAKWKFEILQMKLEKKFNQNGWFTCTTDKEGIYQNISFGQAMNFNTWIGIYSKENSVF
ncbi:MAG: LlaMI family restriction endonuclease [Sulfurovum sp.]|nr:LlaMI family restriction endonuclease [Sulfurovum sp.]